MRRVRTSLIAVLFVGALVAATGCGVTADTTAATLGDQTISVDTVDSLARSEEFASTVLQSEPADSESVLSGTLARSALAFDLQRAGWVEAADRLDLTLDDARADAEASLVGQGVGDLKGTARHVVIDYLAAQSAVLEKLGTLDPSDEASLRLLYEVAPAYWDRLCISGLEIPVAQRDDVNELLSDGVSFSEVPASVSQAVYIEPSEANCVQESQFPDELRAALDRTDTGSTTGEVVINDPSAGPVIYRLKVDERRTMSFGDSQTELEQLGSFFSVISDPPADLSEEDIQTIQDFLRTWMGALLAPAEINPRYGEHVAVNASGPFVVPPPTPVVPTDWTDLESQAQQLADSLQSAAAAGAAGSSGGDVTGGDAADSTGTSGSAATP